MYTTIIFATFIGIFIITALAALADLVGLIRLPDPSARKWLRTGLLTEVIGVILAMATMLLVNKGSEVWTIYGKINLSQELENTSVQQAVFSVAPPTVEIDESGRFEAAVVIRKNSDGTWDYPKIQIAVPGYASRTIHFDDVWVGMGEPDVLDCKKDEDKRQIIIKTPISLDAIKKAYMPSSGEVFEMKMESAPPLGDPI